MGRRHPGDVVRLIVALALLALAIAGVLTFRLITFWLPTVPGFFALGYIRRRRWV